MTVTKGKVVFVPEAGLCDHVPVKVTHSLVRPVAYSNRLCELPKLWTALPKHQHTVSSASPHPTSHSGGGFAGRQLLHIKMQYSTPFCATARAHGNDPPTETTSRASSPAQNSNQPTFNPLKHHHTHNKPRHVSLTRSPEPN